LCVNDLFSRDRGKDGYNYLYYKYMTVGNKNLTSVNKSFTLLLPCWAELCL